MHETLCKDHSISIQYVPFPLFSFVLYDAERLKKTKKGRQYYGCIDNPDCDFMVWQRPSSMKCERCGSLMLYKGNKLVCSNENCGFVTNVPKKSDEPVANQETV